MWIFLNDSFLSVVDKGDEAGKTLLVRARKEGDIERVFPGAEVIKNSGTDYTYRARIDRETVSNAIAQRILDIDYRNFKDTVDEDDRYDAYMKTWQAMFSFQNRQ